MKDKYKAICPRHITQAITDFAHEIAGCTDVSYVPVQESLLSVPMQCYRNSFLHAQLCGGEPVLGYTIWTMKDLFLTSEHHCVVRLPNGEWVDPTPDVASGSQRILFVPTGQPATVEGIEDFVLNGACGHYKVLVDHPLIHRAAETLANAGARLQHAQNTAIAERRGVPQLEWREWNGAIGQVQQMIDHYYRRGQQRMQEREQRRRNKRERMARKKARGRR